MSLVEVRNLSVKFPLKSSLFGKKEYLQAVNDVSFSIEEATVFGLVGESGSGKTTTGKAILNLIKSTSGEIYFNEENVTGKRSKFLKKEMQIIFQDPYSTFNPKKTIRKILEEPLRLHKICPAKEYESRIIEMLHEVGLEDDVLDKYPSEFSGGQLQRISIARVLLLSPHFIVCDESIASLDVSIQAQIINLLHRIQTQYGLTILFISHNISVLRYLSDEFGIMYLGHLVERASVDEIFSNPLHPYTQALLSIVPTPDPHFEDTRKEFILEGEMPSPINPPAGCPFSTRCPKCMEKCKTVKPVYKEVKPGHFCACHLLEVDNN